MLVSCALSLLANLQARFSCNKHVLDLGHRVKASLVKAGITGYQFGTVGVSDGISMGTFGMSYSLQSRDLIADSVETAAGGHWLDGMVTIPVRLALLGRTLGDDGKLTLLSSFDRLATRTCTSWIRPIRAVPQLTDVNSSQARCPHGARPSQPPRNDE